MRLHSLSLTAFGPFAQPLAIDFDALSSEGLFLLSGPTGAGKSSVLDAVCFALFGRVAGERNQAGRLTSDHADPSVRPLVELECTIGSSRLRIVRSPEWVRPKRRGSGTTKQQSSVVLQELRGDQWTTLSTRLDEAGDLIGRRLGVTLDQFLQVAMLPQGGFQTFLTAKADERKQLLEKLFRTDSYLKIEQQFVIRRRAARLTSTMHLPTFVSTWRALPRPQARTTSETPSRQRMFCAPTSSTGSTTWSLSARQRHR